MRPRPELLRGRCQEDFLLVYVGNAQLASVPVSLVYVPVYAGNAQVSLTFVQISLVIESCGISQLDNTLNNIPTQIQQQCKPL